MHRKLITTKRTVKKRVKLNSQAQRLALEDRPRLKVSDILNFSSAIAVVLFTAIFYTSGWVYISTWFSFYGLDANQLQISTQTILVSGIPGILSAALIAFMLYITMLYSTTVYNYFPFANLFDLLFHLSAEEYNEIKNEVMNEVRNEIEPLRFLLILAITAVFAATMFLFIISSLIWLSTNGFFDFLHQPEVFSGFQMTTMTFLSIVYVGISIIASAGVILVITIFLFSDTYWKLRTGSKIGKELHNFVVYLLNLPQLWTGIIIVVYFIIAVVISFFMGEIDARRGGQFMSSNWKMPTIILHSDHEITELVNSGLPILVLRDYQYGPFALLYQNTDGYYLTDLKKTSFYARSPKLYFIPRDVASKFVIEMQPKNDVLKITEWLHPFSTPNSTTLTPIPLQPITPTTTP